MSFERQVRRRRVRLGATAGVMTAALAGGLPAASHAAAFGYAAPYAPLFPSQSATDQFAAFKTGIGAKYARIFAPWDAADTYNPSTGQCVPSNNPAMANIDKAITAAQTAHLDPMISITSWNTSTGTPTNGYNPQVPNMDNQNDKLAYACGIEGLLSKNLADAYEVWNEPDLSGVSYFDSTLFYSTFSKAQVAEGTHVTQVAGALGEQTIQNGNYVHYVDDLMASGGVPVFSFHPYDDVDNFGVSGSAPAETEKVMARINADARQQGIAPPSIWLTEAGVAMGEPSGGALAPNPTQLTLQNSRLDQAKAAQGFLQLGNAPGQAFAGQIARVYYYEFESGGNSDNTNSGVLDSAGNKRASYCVLANHETPAVAAADTTTCPGGSH